VEFDIASSGISGLETALGLSMALVHGDAADIIVFDPDYEWTVDKSNFVSKGKNTPFNGWRLKGRNLLTIVDGKMAYRDARFK